MAKKNKIGLQFDGFEELIEKLDKLSGDLKATTEEALQKSHAYVTPKITAAMDKHHRTGETEGAIVVHSPVEWNGMTAEIQVGFDLEQGGMPSIFLMYGTPKHAPNHPGTNADKELYNAIYSNKTKKEVGQIQQTVFANAIKKKMEE